MKEKPILFSTDMVQAILDGRKTQTRRVFRQITDRQLAGGWTTATGWYKTPAGWYAEESGAPLGPFACPYGQPGDRLWVRETWATIAQYNHLKPSDIPKGEARWPCVWYYAPKRASASAQNSGSQFIGKKRPSIFMPRWASRITLRVTNVRIERVQDINTADIRDEGANSDDWSRPGFINLWDSINAKRGYGWDINPWVWVIEFEKINNAD